MAKYRPERPEPLPSAQVPDLPGYNPEAGPSMCVLRDLHARFIAMAATIEHMPEARAYRTAAQLLWEACDTRPALPHPLDVP